MNTDRRFQLGLWESGGYVIKGVSLVGKRE